MARQRFIHPDIWNDKKIGKLSFAERLFFIGCFSNADDEGRMLGDPAYLRAIIFKYDDMTLDEVKKIRDNVLLNCKNLILYVIDGDEYLHFSKWKEYQKPKYPTPSKIPIPPERLGEDSGNGSGNVPGIVPEGFTPRVGFGLGLDLGLGIDRDLNIIVGEKNSPTPPEPKKYKFNQSHMELAQWLLDCIKKNKPDFKEPNLNEWADTIRLMRERDNRKHETIRDVIKWCQLDSFWKSNILSADKLRKQFDKLEMQMNEKGNGQLPPKESGISRLKRIARGEKVD